VKARRLSFDRAGLAAIAGRRAGGRSTEPHASAASATRRFTPAAIRTDAAAPNASNRKNAPTRHAAAEPIVLTNVSRPIERPTLRDVLTRCETSSGSVAPIATVGSTTRAKV